MKKIKRESTNIDRWISMAFCFQIVVVGIKNMFAQAIPIVYINNGTFNKLLLFVSPYTQYIGWVQSDQTDKYYAASDLVVFPGRHFVFWEQVAGLGKPMLCKAWDDTKHVDLGGNVIFLEKDSADEIFGIIKKLIEDKGVYQKMKLVAEREGMKTFSYSDIAKRSIASSR